MEGAGRAGSRLGSAQMRCRRQRNAARPAGVQREAWVLIQALPSVPACPWAGPGVLICHPRELEQPCVPTGEGRWHR